MEEVISYLVVVILIIGFIYGLVRQIQHTLTMKKNQKIVQYKRILVGNCLSSISFAGFLLSFILNILVYMQFIHSNSITSNGTALSCFVFLGILFIAKFGVIPRSSYENKLPH